MDIIALFKALSNESRLQVMHWLNDPEEHFPEQSRDVNEVGVCVGLIQEKIGLSQSTTSHYLSLLQKANLVIATRIGQWTYYKRNDETLHKLAKYIQEQL